ncbi:exosortase/archaeosortase family protein [Chlorobium phaeovibrioides]|uniref:Exosortase/archaeosortase family protein n=1 Tax=Chlorobium phaeovibrioides TaxID=1094 RepID=A0A3S0NIX3_CHLPH|nr:archaeosortase/exosortase family protein [Chlorobium phaeovibrioides]MWV55082.1 hypothetical protein [Chlorobium phaeovibrioides]QEQ57677.1 exosortase/archaeosortase family protein [Chlorobium phaeovibrioides]RTY34163.1 exosortase/archaeosortase family protein [Chlorobium phaeovibrioides]RTY37784.1 exosortase/archaeosortase family protein [Chlorobium phaeovibrioides]
MTARDYPIIAALLILALFIWIHDLSWMMQPADTLPILLAIPCMFWLGSPWKFLPGAFRVPTGGLAVTTGAFIIGIVTGWMFLLAISWTVLLWSWLSIRIEPADRRRIAKLLILPLMAFPWLLLDAQAVGWWFRLSGSWAAGEFFSLTGFHVVQDGTRLLIQGLPVEVTAACSGMHSLQSMLIAGSALAYIILGHHPIYWLNLPLLVVISWIANTVRIVAIALAALAVSPEFAAGLFHEWGGWGVLILMFGLCWAIFTLQRTLLNNKTAQA